MVTMKNTLVLAGILTEAFALAEIGTAVNSTAAEQAMQSFLSKYPISTRSESQSKLDRQALKEEVLSGNVSLPGPWESLLDPCPWSCSAIGMNSSSWPVYSHFGRLQECNQPILLDFSLYTPVDRSNGHVSIRGCAAQLNTFEAFRPRVNRCPLPGNATTVTYSLPLLWDTGSEGDATHAVAALEQLYAYELVNAAPCNESINFAHPNGVSVGLYTGGALHGQGILAPVLRDLIRYIDDSGTPETLATELYNRGSARHALGVFISTIGVLSAAQAAVQTWRNGSCLDSWTKSKAWTDISFSMPANLPHRANLTSLLIRRRPHAHAHGHEHLHRRDDRECSTVKVVYGDKCTTLAAECGISEAELTGYNPDSNLCGTDTLTPGQRVCCSSGTLPDNTPQPDDDDNFYTYLVAKGNDCSTLAAAYSITEEDVESYNTDTWGWQGCGNLLAGENICLSSGWPPMPAVISNAVCGPQVNGTATAPHGTDLATLNPCPLNACCDIWGQCGITSDFCTPTNSTTGAPGTAANGTNGCISNCGTDIIEGDAPANVFSVGYFEVYDLSRPACGR
jgi:chitinase